MLTQARVLELFNYEDGQLIRKVTVAQRSKAGDVVGCPNTNGYLQVMIDGHHCLVHRVIFLMFRGFLPKIVDHIDCDIRNNRIENLRAANDTQSASNTTIPSDNKSGFKGVSWKSARNKWVAQICVNRKKIHIGVFDSAEEAATAYRVYATNLHGEFANF